MLARGHPPRAIGLPGGAAESKKALAAAAGLRLCIHIYMYIYVYILCLSMCIYVEEEDLQPLQDLQAALK